MPALFVPGWSWTDANTPRPAAAFVCFDADNEFLFVGLRPGLDGTDIIAIPLALGDERETLGAWSRIDPTLSDRGTSPESMVALAAPPIPDDLLAGMLSLAGLPPLPENMDLLGSAFSQQVALKAHQFAASYDQRLARSFVDDYPYQRGAGVQIARRILTDLAASNAQLLPYIQDVPMRIRAIMLQVIGSPGTFWDQLSR